MRQSQRDKVVLDDPVVVERRLAFRAFHLVQVARPADGPGMADRQVVAFHEILGQNLPIGVPDVSFEKSFSVGTHVVVTDKLFNLGKLACYWTSLGVQRDKNPSEPFFASNLRQLVFFFAKSIISGHCRRATK